MSTVSENSDVLVPFLGEQNYDEKRKTASSSQTQKHLMVFLAKGRKGERVFKKARKKKKKKEEEEKKKETKERE